MHGPTFMANPLACAAANASLALLDEGEWQPQVMAIERQLRAELLPLRDASMVKDVRILGAIGVLETTRPVDVARVQRFFVERGVWIRPFGKLLYVMPPYIISQPALTRLTSALRDAVQQPELFQ